MDACVLTATLCFWTRVYFRIRFHQNSIYRSCSISVSLNNQTIQLLTLFEVQTLHPRVQNHKVTVSTHTVCGFLATSEIQCKKRKFSNEKIKIFEILNSRSRSRTFAPNDCSSNKCKSNVKVEIVIRRRHFYRLESDDVRQNEPYNVTISVYPITMYVI